MHQLQLRSVGSVRIDQKLKCEGLQGIAGQNCRCLIPFAMNRWLPAPQIIVIHAGQVIMYERVGMHRLNRARRRCCRSAGNAMQSRPFKDKKGAQGLTAFGGIDHSLRDIRLRKPSACLDGLLRDARCLCQCRLEFPSHLAEQSLWLAPHHPK